METNTDTPTLADIAKVTADDFRRGSEAAIGPALARELALAIELALLTAVRGERRACAAECTRRAALWEKTAARAGIAENARHEAQCRENEALYLADALAVRA
jgi:hypothetical protein